MVLSEWIEIEQPLQLFLRWSEIEQPLQLYAVVEDGCCTVHTLSDVWQIVDHVSKDGCIYI